MYLYHLGLNQPFGHISRETFPLPTLAPVLLGLAGELYSGRGFFVLRTIPVDKYSREEIAIVYAGTILTNSYQNATDELNKAFPLSSARHEENRM
jgi:hypothetical protein